MDKAFEMTAYCHLYVMISLVTRTCTYEGRGLSLGFPLSMFV